MAMNAHFGAQNIPPKPKKELTNLKKKQPTHTNNMTTARVAVCLRFAFLFYVAQGTKIIFTNKCTFTVWPGILSGQNSQLSVTGFELATGASNSVNVPSSWTGRFWGRTGCSNNSGNFTCATADCGSGRVACHGAGAAPPATLAELTVAANGGQDFYDISNVDGFNLPMSIAPQGGNGACKPSSCPANISEACPAELQEKGSDGTVIACTSACLAFNQPQYCCTGEFNTPDNCPSTQYSQFFKSQCPDAYSYAYDDKTSTFTCSGSPDYNVTFCPGAQAAKIEAKINFTNKCPYTVWPGTVANDQNPPLSLTGFELAKGASISVNVPSPWSGLFWGRTGCSSNSGKFTCATADCGSGQVACNGARAVSPATLAELTVAADGGQDTYDISHVDGFNLPMSIAPQGGNGACKPSSCPANISEACPAELQEKGSDGTVIACKSACLALNQPQYCCTGEFNSPYNCPSTQYTQFFNLQCPDAYSSAYDDKSSTFTCSGSPDYVVTFCPLCDLGCDLRSLILSMRFDKL